MLAGYRLAVTGSQLQAMRYIRLSYRQARRLQARSYSYRPSCRLSGTSGRLAAQARRLQLQALRDVRLGYKQARRLQARSYSYRRFSRLYGTSGRLQAGFVVTVTGASAGSQGHQVGGYTGSQVTGSQLQLQALQQTLRDNRQVTGRLRSYSYRRFSRLYGTSGGLQAGFVVTVAGASAGSEGHQVRFQARSYRASCRLCETSGRLQTGSQSQSRALLQALRNTRQVTNRLRSYRRFCTVTVTGPPAGSQGHQVGGYTKQALQLQLQARRVCRLCGTSGRWLQTGSHLQGPLQALLSTTRATAAATTT